MQVQPVDILLVEDNPADVDLTQEALKEWRILNRLHVVSDGVEALEFLRGTDRHQDAPRPDFILLDLNLPRKDGREVLAEIKSDRFLKTIPVVVLSTSDAEMDVVKSYGLGANCYVVKPLGVGNFIDVLKGIGEFWFTVVKLPSSELVAQYRSVLQAVPGMKSRPQGSLEKIRVLVVDDNFADSDYVKELLSEREKPCFEITTCDRLARARQILHSAVFDVVLLDLGLPDSSGLQTYKELAGEFRVPIVINTGYEDEETAIAAIRAGAQDYINKGEIEGRFLSRVLRYAIERKWMEEDQGTLLAREQAARSEAEKAILARDEFLGIASHELKTPLTSLQMQSQLLNEILPESLRRQLPVGVVKLLQGFHQQTERLSRLVRNLLDISRINAGKLLLEFSEVNLVNLVKEVISNHQTQLDESKCSVCFQSQTEIIGLWDRYRIDQVITNLLTNAMKYGRGKPIEIKIEKNETCAKLQVIDHGLGIRQEDLFRIFGRFERVASSQGIPGLGLGLYIARQIVDAHQGRISVDSDFGKSTTFTVELPFRQSAPVSSPCGRPLP